ncbi:MAG: oxalate/formate antiport family MFS transporter [Caldisphaera sp.]|nr:MAG: oxalate/formate antiport family MFS transporter [Caldisphaera sp.]
MSFNSLYQYSWNALSPLLYKGLSVSIQEVSVAFTLFTIFSTIFQIIGGIIADKHGPKIIGIFSSLASSIGFLGTSFSKNLYSFYLFWSIGSAGEGILYMIASNLAVKWFKSNRGLATGLISLGFGLGSFIADPLISTFTSFKKPMLIIGLIELILLPILLYLSDYPSKGLIGISPTKIITMRKWWLIYFSYALSVVPLLSLSSSLYYLASGSSKGILVLLISSFALFSGLGRPILGYVSDKIGRIKTMIIALVLVIIGSFLIILKQFVVSSIIIGIFDGSMIPLYFSFIGDVFGIKYSTSNNAILYTGKALGGIFGGIIFSVILTKGLLMSGSYLLLFSLAGLLLLLLSIIKKN